MSNQDLNIFPNLKVNVPSFLLKIYEILENDSLTGLISWNKEGTSFIVFNPSELSSKVLANYFKHKNYPSFLRQLNMYNFKKTRNQFGQSEFRHRWFRRGLKSTLSYIRRRNQEESDLRIETKHSTQELDNYKREQESLKQIVKDLKETQIKLQEDLNFQIEQSMALSHQNQNTLQAINQTQLQFNQKYDQVILMLNNSINNMPTLVYNFKEIIKYCQEETNQNFCLQNHTPSTRTQHAQYNQMNYYPQRQYSCNNPNLFQLYYYQNDPKQFLYKKNSPLALTASTQNNYLCMNQQCSSSLTQLFTLIQLAKFSLQNLEYTDFPVLLRFKEYRLIQFQLISMIPILCLCISLYKQQIVGFAMDYRCQHSKQKGISSKVWYNFMYLRLLELNN
ncbi:unnamed protein product [Paramecium octaurelia]|uniref:HSF-type DNA-binding domain-containing protein n=1 Tax=Paramecium octaurelia TaxID=43137 RepID=A0A8S1UV63_PAROT|nr:unnamed protein product [Paramecium octaurelia]